MHHPLVGSDGWTCWVAVFLDVPIAEPWEMVEWQQEEIINGRANKEQAELWF